MKSASLVVAPSDRPPALNVLGVQVTVLATNTQTDHIEVTLQSGAAGVGPPPHSHGWDESFYVLSGRVDMLLEGRPVTCGAGTLVHVPAGTTHAFAFATEGAQMLEITGVRGRATQLFEQVSRDIAPDAPDLPLLGAVLARHGVRLA